MDLPDLLTRAAPLSSSLHRLIKSSDELFLPHTLSLLRTPQLRVLARRVVPSHRDFCQLFWGAPVPIAERGVKLLYLLQRMKLPPWHPEHFSLTASVYTKPRTPLTQPAEGAAAAAGGGGGGAAGGATHLARQDRLALSAAGLMSSVLVECLGAAAMDERGAGGQYEPQAQLLRTGAWLVYALAFCLQRQRGCVHMPSAPADGRPPPVGVLPLLRAWRVPETDGGPIPPASAAAVSAAGALGNNASLLALMERLFASHADPQSTQEVARGLSASPLGRVFRLDDPAGSFSRAGEQPLVTQGGARVVAGGAALEFTFAPEATRAFYFTGMEGCQSHVCITATNRQLSTATRVVRVGQLSPGGPAARPLRPLRTALMEMHSAVGAQECTLHEAREYVGDTALRHMNAAGATGGYWPDGASHYSAACTPCAVEAAQKEAVRRFATADGHMGGLLHDLHPSTCAALTQQYPEAPTAAALTQPLPSLGPLSQLEEALKPAVQPAGQSSGGGLGAWDVAMGGLCALTKQRARQQCVAATWARCSDVGEGGARVLGKMFKSDPGAYLSGGAFESSGASSIGSLTLATAHEYSAVPSGSKGARIVGIRGASEVNWVTARFSVDELFRVAVATDRIEILARRLADEVQEVLAVRQAQLSRRLPLTLRSRPSARLGPFCTPAQVVAHHGPAAVGYGSLFQTAFADFPAFDGALEEVARRQAQQDERHSECTPTLCQRSQRQGPLTPKVDTPDAADFLHHGFAAANSCGAPEVPYHPPMRGAFGTIAAPPTPPAAPRGGVPSGTPFLSDADTDSAAAVSSSSAAPTQQHDDDSDGEDDGEVVVGGECDTSAASPPSRPEQADLGASQQQKPAQACSKKRSRSPMDASSSSAASSASAAAGAGGGSGGGGGLSWPHSADDNSTEGTVVPMHAWWAALWRSDAELGWVWVPAYYAWNAVADRPAVQALGGAGGAAAMGDLRHWDALQTLAGEISPFYATGATNATWWLI